MSTDTTTSRPLLFRVLILGAVVLLAAAYFSPIWWVSLKAPQYPETAFPQGIRIHFHIDAVFNGCKKIEIAEKYEAEALDCKHEMDAINHFVGMYPIAAGGPVEKALSPFLFSLLGVMMLAFAAPGRGSRVGLLAAGSVLIAVWMSVAMYSEGGVHLLSPNYVTDLAGTMDLEPEDYADWTGFKAIDESYTEALGRYFREAVEIARRVDLMLTAGHVVYWATMAGMVVLVLGVWLLRPAVWLLGLVPALVPVIFVAEYAAWLWWFGHNLHDMAAFTLKPFMPTVFGQGKVAQFGTFSYPHYGFGLLVASSLLMIAAVLIRRKHPIEADG